MDTLWQELLEHEQRARSVAFEHQDRPDADERLREWWLTVHDALYEYLRSTAARGEPPQPPPVGLLSALSRIAKDLSVGRVTEVVKKAAKRGRPGAGYAENRDILIAVAYIHAADPGGLMHEGECIRVDDPDPVERIHLWYGATERTIKEWRQKLKPDPRPLGANRINAGILTNLTWDAAQRYREGSRTMLAIGKRAAKRRRNDG